MTTWKHIALYCMLSCMLGYAVRDWIADPRVELALVYRTPDLYMEGNTMHLDHSDGPTGLLYGVPACCDPQPPHVNNAAYSPFMQPDKEYTVHLDHPHHSTCGASILHKGSAWRVELNGEKRQFATRAEAVEWGCR